MSEEELTSSDDEFWRSKRTVTDGVCAACGEECEKTWYPMANEHPIGDVVVYDESTETEWFNPESEVLAASICPRTEEAVLVYAEGEGWEKPGDEDGDAQ